MKRMNRLLLTVPLAIVFITHPFAAQINAAEGSAQPPDTTGPIVLWDPTTGTHTTAPPVGSPQPYGLRAVDSGQETLYACKWLQEFDSTKHWKACDNHRESGTYNGETHGDQGKRNVEPHTIQTYREPTCQLNGIDRCLVCSYQEEKPQLDHNLVGDLVKGPANYGWCCQRCNQPGCTAKQARSQPCMYDVVKAPTTTSTGILRCYECGNEIATDKLKTCCPDDGGQHWLDGVVMQFEDNPDWCTSEEDVMTCVKCGDTVVIREHLNDGVCKLDYLPFIYPEVYYIDVSENTAQVELYFGGDITVTEIDSIHPYIMSGSVSLAHERNC